MKYSTLKRFLAAYPSFKKQGMRYFVGSGMKAICRFPPYAPDPPQRRWDAEDAIEIYPMTIKSGKQNSIG